jgi:hypothetical protein
MKKDATEGRKMYKRLISALVFLVLLFGISFSGLAAGDAIDAVVSHTSRTDFSPLCAVHSSTYASDLDGGAVVLASDLSDDFPGSTLDTLLWTSGSWSVAPYNPIVGGGILTLPGGGYVRSNATFTHGVIEAVAEFGAGNTQHIGFAPLDFAPWNFILFSTHIGDGNLYTRIANGFGTDQVVSLGPIPTGYHRYTIEWTSFDASTDQIRFFVDGVLTSGSPFYMSNTGASNYYLYQSNNGSANLSVEYVQAAPTYAAAGTYTSCTLDAGVGNAWQSISWNASVPVGAGLIVETRTSDDGLIWNGWNVASTSSGSSISPARYVEYKLSLSGDTQVTPQVNSLTLLSMIWEGGAPLDYGQLVGLPNSINYTAWLDTSVDVNGIPAEVITEDAYNAVVGTNLGYQNKYWLVSADKFTAPGAATGDTINMIFGGLLTDAGELWGTSFVWNDGIVEHTPPAPVIAPSGGECPVMLPGSFTPGSPAEKVVNWSGAAGKYHVYFSVTPSGASNGQSNGVYEYAGSVEGAGPIFSFTDVLPDGITDSWHVVVPADPGTNTITGCHTEAESSPTATTLSVFRASTPAQPTMIIVFGLLAVVAAAGAYFLTKYTLRSQWR